MKQLPLDTPLVQISGIGPKFLAKLKRLDIGTIRDLLWHFPSRYEDYSLISSIADLQPNQQTTIRGVVEDVSSRRSFRRRMTIVEATISDSTDTITAVWFNQPYIQTSLAEGIDYNFSGKVTIRDGNFVLVNPAFERNTSAQPRHTAGLIPIYPETRGLTSKGFRYLIRPLLAHVEGREFLPDSVLANQHLPDFMTALRNVHAPKTIEDALVARERFAFENLFLLHLSHLHQKSLLARERACVIPADIAIVKETLAKLPFELTPSQKQSLWEIMQDMEKPHPMNRLLQGDVGSGKTILAALAALIAARTGCQTAILAPTDVLARQHFETFSAFFDRIADAVTPLCLLTGKTACIRYEQGLTGDISRAELLKNIKNGSMRIIIGTHALIQKTVGFDSLGLVIVDEQHRFGVEQRAQLLKASSIVPHFLSMSATPIPRTIMMTAFGDLDVSTITELPRGRKRINTKVIDQDNRSSAYQFIREEIQKGRQAFVICPRIDPPEDATKEEVTALEVKNVMEEYDTLGKKIFPDCTVGMLHGKLKVKEKEEIMRDFKSGQTNVLVSTSVIEVGIDVPNATIMLIEGAERFGLAQLYQFRGRVGRSSHQSHCFLFTTGKNGNNNKRLRALLEAKNGFELAEKDLEIRGPGEFLGQKQAGMPDLPMKSMMNVEIIKRSRDSSVQILNEDPSFKAYPELKKRLAAFRKRIHLE